MEIKKITCQLISRAKARSLNFKDWDVAKVLVGIKEILMECPTTVSEDVTSLTTREKLTNKIYTKKIKFDIPIEVQSKCSQILQVLEDIEYVSLSCDSEDFNSSTASDIRINCKNRYNEWVNTYASTFSVTYLRLLYAIMLEMTRYHLIDVYDVFVDLDEFIEELEPENIKDLELFFHAVKTFKETATKACQ